MPATQHLRHPAQPLHTPETDLVHDLLGHGVMLANPLLRRLHRLAGEAARRLEDPAALDLLARVWHATCERGVVVEEGVVRCYGAELVSCPGWATRVRRADIRRLDFAAIGAGAPGVLWCAESPAHLEASLTDFYEAMDDATPQRLAAG